MIIRTIIGCNTTTVIYKVSIQDSNIINLFITCAALAITSKKITLINLKIKMVNFSLVMDKTIQTMIKTNKIFPAATKMVKRFELYTM